MPKKILRIVPLIAAVSLLTMLAAPVFAQDPGKLWFYSVDPPLISGKLANPDGSDGWTDDGYVGFDTDPWIEDSIVLLEGYWDDPSGHSLWIGLHGGSMSYDTTLVISVNDVAYGAIATMTVEGSPVTFITTAPTHPPYPIAPHGVFNSADWAAYGEVNVGDIQSETAIEINFVITLNTDLEGAKIHFDAYGWTTEEHGDSSTAEITNPYSHDFTFMVPEAATILVVSSSLVALGAYAYKRKRQ